jgi:fructose-1,6-bisphosphatase II
VTALASLGPSRAPGFGIDGRLVWQALEATRAAAVAAAGWAGRGDPRSADAAATAAMRAVLRQSALTGVVITGEGAKDAAPMLADGERLGSDPEGGEGSGTEAGTGSDTEAGTSYDIAVDPLECTDLCAAGLPGALATIALAPRGSMWSPGPAFYMEKLIVPAAARSAVSLTDPPEVTLDKVARALGRGRAPRVVVLDKPRHRELITRLRAAGAIVRTPAAGDVAGALEVLLPDGDADLLIGIGGTPEGVMAACAARALGGGMWGRLSPQRLDEAAAVRAAGLDTDRVLGLEDLIGQEGTFLATGVTGGLLAPPLRTGDQLVTESLVVSSGSVQLIRHSTTTEE